MNYEKLIPFIKERLTKHHELYSGQCKAEYWEENCAYALRKAGFGSDWAPDFNHGVGVDQSTNNGTRVSNKGGEVTDDDITISGSRLTKHKTLDDKLEFLSVKKEDYIFCLGTNKKDWKNGIRKYHFIVIDSKKLNYQDHIWNETLGVKGAGKGKVNGWAMISEWFSAKIQKSMSDQLWTTVKLDLVEYKNEITIG